MYVLISLPYEECTDVFERLWVFWIMVNIMKYDYYCQNALNKAGIGQEIDSKHFNYLECSMRHTNHS